MKTIVTFAAIAIAASSLSLVARAHDGEPAKPAKAQGEAACCADKAGALLSPKAQSLRSTFVSGVSSDPDLVHGLYPLGAGKRPEMKTSVAATASKSVPDLLAAYRNSSRSPKSMEQSGSRAASFEIAPMK